MRASFLRAKYVTSTNSDMMKPSAEDRSAVCGSFWSFGKEQEFKPHIKHIEPFLTECDLDWKSRLLWIPEPRYSDAPFPHIKDAKFPGAVKLMRSFPQANMATQTEWSFYPNFGLPKIYHTGKRCFIDGVNHVRSMRSSSERTLESSIGRKKQQKRDESFSRSRRFLLPEYSLDFHKLSSRSQTTTESLTRLQPLSHFKLDKRSLSNREKVKSRAQEEDVLEVQRLDLWRPAPGFYDRIDLKVKDKVKVRDMLRT